jgi:hypothetical protein
MSPKQIQSTFTGKLQSGISGLEIQFEIVVFIFLGAKWPEREVATHPTYRRG